MVSAVNDAPVLDATKSPTLATLNEDAPAPAGAVGTLVSALVDFATPAGQVDNVTDVDAGALLGIAVTAADASNGTWFFSTNGGTTWTPLGAVTDAAARLLAADATTRLYFQPTANFSGTLATAITFRAWDRTSGTNGTLVDTSVNGTPTAFSSATDTVAITVTPVNDAPVLDASRSPVLNAGERGRGRPGAARSARWSRTWSTSRPPPGRSDNVTDADTGALLGIAITAADTTNGTWFYSLNGGTTWTRAGRGREHQRPAARRRRRQPALLPAHRQLQRHPRRRHHLPCLGPDERHRWHPA